MPTIFLGIFISKAEFGLYIHYHFNITLFLLLYTYVYGLLRNKKKIYNVKHFFHFFK